MPKLPHVTNGKCNQVSLMNFKISVLHDLLNIKCKVSYQILQKPYDYFAVYKNNNTTQN